MQVCLMKNKNQTELIVAEYMYMPTKSKKVHCAAKRSETLVIGCPRNSSCVLINFREYRRCDHKWTIQRNVQHWAHKTQHKDKQNKKYTTIYVGHHYAKTNTNNVNKT